MAAGGEDGGGRRRRRPPRRRARSPEGERATVERLGDGASRPCPSHRRAVEVRRARLALYIRTVRTKATPAVVMAVR
jgi:hypothetical protein